MEKLYKCSNCGKVFDEPNTVKTTYEAYYGVSSSFAYGSPLYYDVCPYCDSEDIDRYYPSDEEEEEE